MQIPRHDARRDTSRSPLGPRLLYFTRTDLPSRKANSIQSMNTCWELARQGTEVVLVVQELTRSRRECFEFYGLPEEPRLRLTSLSLPIAGEFNDWKGKTFRGWLRSFLARWATPGSVVFTRDPAGLELLRVLEDIRMEVPLKTVFEVHKVSFLVKASHQLERGRSLEHPRVAARVDSRKRLEQEVYGCVDGIVCTSENARRLLQEHFDTRAPVQVIRNGTRIPRQRDGSLLLPPPLDDAARDLDALYVGQLYAWKGVDLLVRAMARLPGRRLDIVGGNVESDVERLGELIRAEGLEDRVRLHGYVPPHRVQQFLARAKVGVIPLPSAGYVEATWFTSPLKLFELWQNGVPVLASAVPSMQEIVENGGDALLVPPDDVEALADGLRRLLEDRAQAAALVAQAAARVQEYSWERRAQRLRAFVDSLQADTSGKRGAVG